jgi:hypothetical protein
MFPERDLLTELKPSIAELRAIDLRSSHQFEEEIGNASSANGLLFHKTEFSMWRERVYVRTSNKLRKSIAGKKKSLNRGVRASEHAIRIKGALAETEREKGKKAPLALASEQRAA